MLYKQASQQFTQNQRILRGDSLGLEVVPKVVLHLGNGLALLVDILNPVATQENRSQYRCNELD